MATTSAQTVAAELRRRLPGLPTKKLHKLLYYCQGHHLATFDVPMFSETISAWDMGPVVGQLWKRESEDVIPAESSGMELPEAVLNTIGYVTSRYGALTGADLQRLTHSEDPWREADRHRVAGSSVRISPESIGNYFRQTDADDLEEGAMPLDSDEVRAMLVTAASRQDQAATPDTAEALRTRLQTCA